MKTSSCMAFVLHINGNTSNQHVGELFRSGHELEAAELHMKDPTFLLINYLSHQMPYHDKLDLLARI